MNLGRPNQPDAAFFRRFGQLRIEERPVHGRLQRFGEIGFDVLARVAFVVLMDEDVGGAEELRLRPLFVAGQALAEIARPREEERRPAAPAGAWAGEAIDGRRLGELFMRAMHAEAMQTT